MAGTASADAAFDDLFRREYPGLVRRVRVVVGSTAVAEEVVQEAFCTALERWSAVCRTERPGAWVQVVALRLAVKQEGRRRKGSALVPGWSVGRLLRAADVDLERAIAELSPGQRSAVVLHHVLDLPVGEVAEVLGVSPGTVKTQLHRGRARLAELLGEPEEVSDGAR